MIKDWWYIILCFVILVVSQASPIIFSILGDEVPIQQVSTEQKPIEQIPEEQTEIEYVNVDVTPKNIVIVEKDNFTVDIYCTPTEPIVAYEFKLSFDSTKVNAISVERGDIFGDFVTKFNPGIIDNENGTVINIYELLWPTSQGNVSDTGILASISFNVISQCDDLFLELYDVGITNRYKYINTTVSTSVVVLLSAHKRGE